MSHYETLGVPRDASPDDIKKAFRRRSSQAHPDKGGSTEDQQAINRAYECLSDPERRAAYDATGTDQQGPSIEQEARQTLVQLFTGALEHSTWSIVADVRQMLVLHQEQLAMAQREARARRERLIARRGKVRIKQGENLVEMIIESQVQGLDTQINNMCRGLEVNRAARKMLEDYEQDEQQQRPVTPQGSWFFPSTFFNGSQP